MPFSSVLPNLFPLLYSAPFLLSHSFILYPVPLRLLLFFHSSFRHFFFLYRVVLPLFLIILTSTFFPLLLLSSSFCAQSLCLSSSSSLFYTISSSFLFPRLFFPLWFLHYPSAPLLVLPTSFFSFPFLLFFLFLAPLPPFLLSLFSYYQAPSSLLYPLSLLYPTSPLSCCSLFSNSLPYLLLSSLSSTLCSSFSACPPSFLQYLSAPLPLSCLLPSAPLFLFHCPHLSSLPSNHSPSSPQVCSLCSSIP